MYRSAARRAQGEGPDRELVYDAIDRGGKRTPAVALLCSMIVPTVVTVMTARFFGSTESLVALGASTLVAVGLWLRRPGPGVVLRVIDGELQVIPRGKTEPTSRIRLADLLDVALDTKTIQRVEEGSNAIPGMRFLDTKVGAETSVSRVVLVRREGADVPLSEDHLVHMDATEGLGKVRVFLRRHGWAPADETGAVRVDEDDEDEDEDDEESHGALARRREP